jgi:DNA-binding response OmpR family regulator
VKPFCPCCGYDLINDQPILLNDFAMMSSVSQLTYKGQSVRLTEAEKLVCWSLMKACPDPVRNIVVLERLGSDGTPENIKVHICHIRRKLRGIGAPDPFEACYSRAGGGYRWKL